VFGQAEALAHLERAVALWDAVPAAPELAGLDLARLDLARLCSWAAEVASQTGAAPRAVEFMQHAIELVGHEDPVRVAFLLDMLGRYLHECGRTHAGLAAFERAVELVPAQPPSLERAQALAPLRTGLALAWRHDESLAVRQQRSHLLVWSERSTPSSRRLRNSAATSPTSVAAKTASPSSGKHCVWPSRIAIRSLCSERMLCSPTR
jgi:hypothetical protein